MAKSFIMAREGPVTNWYSYLTPRFVLSWNNLKLKLKQGFQGFGKIKTTSVICPNALKKIKNLFMITFKGSFIIRFRLPTSPKT